MANETAKTVTTNIVPVQAIFNEQGVCIGLVGPGGEFFSPPLSSDTITYAIITNSTIDSTIIGGSVPAVGTFSQLNSGNVNITGGSISGVNIQITALNNTPIGNLAPSTGNFTTLGATDLTVTNTIVGSISGNAATATYATTAGSATTATTATTATKANNLIGGGVGYLPYQSGLDSTTFLALGSNGQVLTINAGVPSWATPTVGTVTSVSGTGSVSGITLTGTVTSSGSLTLGGSLDLSSPPAIGGTTANSVTGTIITANTKFVGAYLDASGTSGGALRTSASSPVLQWGVGGAVKLTLDGSFDMNPVNYSISIQPTGTGTVTINPQTIGGMDNVTVGGISPSAGTFTTLRFNSTLSLNGSTGTAGQVLQSNGASAPTWVTPTSYATVTDDTSSSATFYPLFANATAGNLTTEYTSSTKLQYVPSTGTLKASVFSGSGASLTNIPNSALTNSSITIGSSSVSLGGTLSTFAGVSISGSTNTLSNIGNSSLTNSSITINGTSISLGGSATVTASNPSALTVGTGLQLNSGTTYDGSSAKTISIDATVATIQYAKLATSASVASGGQFFTASVRPNLLSGHMYRIEYNLIFTKNTAGTVTFGFSNSAAVNFTPINADISLVVAGQASSAYDYSIYAASSATASAPATLSLADATTYSAKIVGFVIPASDTRLQLTVTDSAGTVTSLLGSNFIVTDLGSATTVGNIG